MSFAGRSGKQDSKSCGHDNKADRPECACRLHEISPAPGAGEGKKAAEKAAKAKENAIPHGKQTVKELIGQNQGVSNMDIAKTDLRGFEKVAQKYGVDYAIRKDASQQPPRYIVFFKARDADALTSAFREYSASVMKKKDRPSVLKALKKMKELVASIPDKVRNKDKEHSL